MEKQNSQCDGANTRLVSGVAHCQSQYQYHFWVISSMFEAYYTGK